MRFLFTAIILCLVLSAGCRHDGNDQRLVRIAELTGTSPRQALEALDSINPSELSEGDRHLFDLLTIKAKDKQYITHTSDSLILDVISYYDRHRDNPHYPEALYYGGRVYSDLGDYPTSLTYFHNSLDNLSDNPSQLRLKCHVLSQTGRLLNKMRMYKDASICIREAYNADSVLNDTLNLMYDAMLLGHNFQDMGALDEDRKWYNISRRYAIALNSADSSVCDLFIARSYFLSDMMDSAYHKIQGIPEIVPSDFRNNALTVAAEIFLAKNMIDTAAKYAYLLLNSPDPINKRNGYEILFSPQIVNTIPSDSLRVYLLSYHRLLEIIMNGHQPQLEAEQQAHYNYSLHEKKAKKALANTSGMKRTLIIIISCMIVAGLCIFLEWRRKKRDYRHLQNRLSDLEHLQQLTLNNEEDSSKAGSSPEKCKKDDNWEGRKSRDELISEIREMLKEMETAGETYKVPEIIIDSDIYKSLSDNISENRFVAENSEFWKQLEKTVLEASPYFRYHLQLLSGAPVKEQFYHMALLIKCGITPTGIGIFMGRSKGTISNTRANMAKLILGEKQSAQVMDSIIRIL